MQGAQEKDVESGRIILALLKAVEGEGYKSQRHLAAELGVALGLVNAYLKRCVKKGLLKVKQAPATRYSYYVTPRGLSEKARLTFEFLSYSLSFFRAARTECAELLAEARARGVKRVALAGVSDLAEIVTICASDGETEIVAIVDAGSPLSRFAGHAVVDSYEAIEGRCDAIVITDIKAPRESYAKAVAHFGRERVLTPALLGVGPERKAVQ